MHPILTWTNPEIIPGTRKIPKYPRSARKAGVAARLVLFVVIDEEGSVTSVQVGKLQRLSVAACAEGRLEDEKTDIPVDIQRDLAEAAAHALLKWRYTPALRNGKPTKIFRAELMEFCPREASSP